MRQDATMRKNSTRPTPAPFTTQELGGGERVGPHSSGTLDGNGSGSTSICPLHENIQAAYQSDPLFSKQKFTQRPKNQEGLWYARDKIVVPSSPLLSAGFWSCAMTINRVAMWALQRRTI